MTSSVTIELDGLEEILRNVDSIAKLEGLQAALLAGGEQVKRKVVVYPPQTMANSPDNPTGRWYERTYGPRWRRRDGSVGGSPTSEDLKHSWNVQAIGQTVVVGTDTTYAPYVHDKEKQAKFHKDRGWKTIQDIGEQEAPTIIRFISDYMTRKFGLK